MSITSLKVGQFDLVTWLIAAVCIAFAADGVWRIARAIRSRKDRALSNPVYAAELVLGVFAIVFLPIVVLVVHWFGDLAGLAMTFVGLVVVLWVDETKKHPDVDN